ncbi:MAG: 2-phospho-L-lactate transferase [Halioglobus sp.]|nr:2-phospho-L-lactate transferase [Halioglobus sp.]
MDDLHGCVLALTGGVGGAKLALGLADVLAPGQLHLLVNTSDDFEHLGLSISPDLDTALYTLAGVADTTQGWGLAGETWNTLQALERLGGDTWFRLGDRDIATHLWRTQQLAAGRSLSEVGAALAQRLGVASHIHPMTDDRVRTVVHTASHDLSFQQYFVRDRCAPAVTGFSFEGIASARFNSAVGDALRAGVFSRIVVCPSNPYVSVDPILQLPDLWQALRDSAIPVVAVSPIVAGMALKGPAAKMMSELGVPATALAVAQHYGQRYPGLLDCFVIDHSDAPLAGEIGRLGMAVAVTSTVMQQRQDKRRLARFVVREALA